MKSLKLLLCIFVSSIMLFSCKSGPFNLLKPQTPHQAYQKKISAAGLDQTAMGAKWLANAQESLQNAVAIKLPYQEKGYFSAEKNEAIAFKFNLLKGQKLQIKLDRKQISGFDVFSDVFESESGNYKLLASADTLGTSIQLDAEKTGLYILRLQPELLGAGEFTLGITSGASLDFPLKTANRNSIKSFWGVDRDNGARRHEGIDIFAPLRTPVLAVAAGTVTRVNTNNLGGKVVWFRPNGKDYTLYYAHLDEQSVTEGEAVVVGDTLGRMGTTGNAIGGLPHLHLGIYTNGGAVDPLPFVDPTVQVLPKIISPTVALNTTMRTNAKVALLIDSQQVSLPDATILRITAALSNKYRIELPDGKVGYLKSNQLSSISKPLCKQTVSTIEKVVFDKPDSAAAVKSTLKNGEMLNILGSYENYYLVVNASDEIGWIEK
ncbi:peptidoglycan DD-metalloendopeptidase family protein [Pedobacter cryotolerans]|uniref:M23 family metallopeptidase n=1 Tax=Pedobacter cryotolerans TaxID=2571270 RepID=A0A4U1C5D2_9SPHI|nr:peptidoglycan DD-metalloendopeptidase family protein [Pedobacter cryotolerans]TKB99670.1 M23 family metallopeptidase [Pedobacter cryotolerans]